MNVFRKLECVEHNCSLYEVKIQHVKIHTALRCPYNVLTWQSASEQTLPTADNSVPLREPQKRQASELLVVGLPSLSKKKKNPL